MSKYIDTQLPRHTTWLKIQSQSLDHRQSEEGTGNAG